MTGFVFSGSMPQAVIPLMCISNLSAAPAAGGGAGLFGSRGNMALYTMPAAREHFCTECGAPIQQSHNFCSGCGRKLK